MERIREARRHDTAAGNGPPSRRRHRTASLRDSPDGPTELQETVRLRDRAMRRERDRDLLDRDKRRRVERFVRASNREGGEESTEESVGGEEDDRMENRGSHSNHSHRKSSLSATVAWPPESMAVDEIVGVAVPRKARSSAVKRSHEYLVSGNVSTSRWSGDSISPANSNLSVGKKMKGTLNVSKSSSESQENIEIEIAEVLYGLMKQSQGSKKESFVPNSSQKLESDHSISVVGSEQPTKREASLQNLTSEKCEASVQVASFSMEIQKEVAEQASSRRMTIESGHVETIVMAKEESPSGPKLNNDLQDLTMTKRTSLGDKTQQEKINSSTKKQSKETLVSQEEVVKVEETKMKSTQEKHKWLTLDLEKEEQYQTRDDKNVGSSNLEQEQKQQKLPEPTIPKKEKSDPPPSSSALTNNRPHWASSLPPLCSTAMSIDGNTGTSKAQQDPHCPLSQPRAKRCTTHHHIARNIYLHQQFVETNKFRLAPAGSASMFDTTPCNLSLMLPPNPSQGGCVSANVNSTHGQGNTPGRSEKDKSFGVATNSNDDNVHRKQLVFQQTLQPALVGNLQHGPALIIHTGQNQAAGATASTQPGVSKSITSVNNPPSSTNTSAARNLPTSTPLPAGAATMSFSYPVIAANEAPCLAMLPNNGYPIPPPAFLGATPGQAMPYFNGPFYSHQMFHPSQLHQQQQPPHSQASSGSSSSSHKKLQPWGSQNKANSIKQTLNPQSSIELVPQAFTVSFASPNGDPVAPNISFSSMAAPNPALFHNLPHSNQVVAAGQMAQQRHYQEGKESKAASASGQTHLFDNSARTLNFMAPPVIGNWSSRSTAVTSASPVSANSKQQHQLQLQKQHVPASMPSNHVASVSTKFQSNSPNPQLLHLQKQQPAPTSSNLAASTHSSAMIFSQAPNQNYAFGQSQSQSPHWKTNSARNSAPNIVSLGQNPNTARNHASNMASLGQNPNSAGNYASSNMASPSQNQNTARNSTSKMASSLNQNPAGNYASNIVSSELNPNSARNYASSLASSGQNQISFAGATVTCSPMDENGSSNLRTASIGSAKAGSSAPTVQQIDNSTTTRTSQKSSPVCGRNVPSILMSPPPNHLSELKH